VKLNVEISTMLNCFIFCRGNPEEGLSFHGTYSIFRRTKMSDSELAMRLLNRFHLFFLSIAISCSAYAPMNECPKIEKLFLPELPLAAGHDFLLYSCSH